MNRVLSLSLRPKTLDHIIGQDNIIKELKNQFASGRVPHFFIIAGGIGTGKTTLARIIAMMLQKTTEYDIHKYDIQEINASDKNGIDDIRQLISISKYAPMKPSVAKVIIMDEAHQLTSSAQNALLKLTEDTPSHLYIIFCTSIVSKIQASLRRRAYIINTQTLDLEGIQKLLRYAKEYIKHDIDTHEFEKTLLEHDIVSPGLVLQAFEKYINGIDATRCVTHDALKVDTLALCKAIAKGSWPSVVTLLKEAKKDDIYPIRNCVLGYLKTILLSGNKSLQIAQAMKLIGDSPLDDLPMFMAHICLACEKISPTVVRKA